MEGAITVEKEKLVVVMQVFAPLTEIATDGSIFAAMAFKNPAASTAETPKYDIVQCMM